MLTKVGLPGFVFNLRYLCRKGKKILTCKKSGEEGGGKTVGKERWGTECRTERNHGSKREL